MIEGLKGSRFKCFKYQIECACINYMFIQHPGNIITTRKLQGKNTYCKKWFTNILTWKFALEKTFDFYCKWNLSDESLHIWLFSRKTTVSYAWSAGMAMQALILLIDILAVSWNVNVWWVSLSESVGRISIYRCMWMVTRDTINPIVCHLEFGKHCLWLCRGTSLS